jgi:hypothetical protein
MTILASRYISDHGVAPSMAAPYQGNSGNVFAVSYIQFSRNNEEQKKNPSLFQPKK